MNETTYQRLCREAYEDHVAQVARDPEHAANSVGWYQRTTAHYREQRDETERLRAAVATLPKKTRRPKGPQPPTLPAFTLFTIETNYPKIFLP